MTPSAYLNARLESCNRFARRAGVPQRTMADVLGGADPRVSTAIKIVAASRAEPAPCGGVITFEDLGPVAAADPSSASRGAA